MKQAMRITMTGEYVSIEVKDVGGIPVEFGEVTGDATFETDEHHLNHNTFPFTLRTITSYINGDPEDLDNAVISTTGWALWGDTPTGFIVQAHGVGPTGYMNTIHANGGWSELEIQGYYLFTLKEVGNKIIFNGYVVGTVTTPE